VHPLAKVTLSSIPGIHQKSYMGDIRKKADYILYPAKKIIKKTLLVAFSPGKLVVQ
jgi:hypothetical protein